eukprot:TRINITY_DN333_c0_g2_i1.p1 TRINITY_DN333_c0_g2~~TRINITY_DN333_c0_g2_i1.p1  ORF type:complete len:165 (-),score=70.39 TRINITY_DN333_c0_g2_i1:215-709(-)
MATYEIVNSDIKLGWTKVATNDELSESGISKCKRFQINGRYIALFKHQGNYYATDASCFHAGNGLMRGDIEDFADKISLVCPSHRRRIDLQTGAELIKENEGTIISRPNMQRIHLVQIFEDGIYVKLQDNKNEDGSNQTNFISDKFAFTDPLANLGRRGRGRGK